MIYKKFNKYIYKHFFKKENIGETIIMAVDNSIMERFYKKHSISEKEFKKHIRKNFKYNWNSAIKKEKKIPQIFGLIAIQIYVAFLMQKEEGNYTEREYNPRLENYLEIYNLQQLYENHQDDLWGELKKWTKKNNFIVEIPQPKTYSGRYTQYPLSQALLNQEDLKKIPLLFENVRIKPEEYISFKDFIYLIKNSDINIELPNHYYRVKKRLQKQNKENTLYYQLFWFFNNEWDGSYPDKTKRSKRKNKRIEKNRTYLTVTNTLKDIKILNESYKSLYESSLENPYLFNEITKYYNLFHKDILFLNHDSYDDEWIDSRFLTPNNEYIIICKVYSQAESYIHKLDKDFKKYDNRYYSVFKVQIKNKASKHFYWKFFFSKKSKQYKLENGLKLSRKTWMLGAGPTISFAKKTKVFINGEKLILAPGKLNYSCKDYNEGTYVLKVKDLSPEKFHIKKPKAIPYNKLHGWQIDKKEYKWQTTDKNYQILGLSTWFPTQIENASIRIWINKLSEYNINSEKQNSSVVVNAIKRARYGI